MNLGSTFKVQQPQHNADALISGPKLAPLSGKAPQNLVILLHGYGANGDDLLSLAKSWQPLIPDTEFIAPHAPLACLMSPFDHSYQWFPLDNLHPSTIESGIEQALPALNRYIDQELKARNFTDSQLMLVGFSQGTMMALAAGLNREKTCAGVLGYSGTFVYPKSLPIRSKPDVFLIHGDADDILTIDHMVQAAEALSDLGIRVKSFVAKGIGHYIDAHGQQLGGQFLQDHLNPNAKGETK